MLHIILQIKTRNHLILYGVLSCILLVLGVAFYICHKSFRRFVNSYIKNHVFFVVTFLSFYILYLVSRLFFEKTLFVSLFDEDGLFESLTAVFFLLAAMLFLFSLSGKKRFYINFFIAMLAIMCFFVGMEEISWGQRIFNIETPAELRQINYQDEITIHNLISPDYHPLIYFIFSLFCMVFFAFKGNRRYDSLFWVEKVYLPSQKFIGVALLLPLITIYNMEHFEVILSFLFLAYGIQLFRRKRRAKEVI